MRISDLGSQVGGQSGAAIAMMFATFFVLVGTHVDAAPSLPGDYNGDGRVSHADYSVLGDTFGSTADLRADGNFNGVVDAGDFAFYSAHYGEIASLPATLPLTVNVAPTPAGNLEWTFVFSNVDGALAGHLNITAVVSSILSIDAGPQFRDDGTNPIGVPGKRNGGIVTGLSYAGNQAFAALGTTLTSSPGLLNSSSTLEFVKLVTAGTGATMLMYNGEVGYQGQDYLHTGFATYVPEPSSWLIALTAMTTFTSRRRCSGRGGGLR